MCEVSDAIAFAVESHRGQFRKGVPHLPFVVHPMDVFMTLRDWGIDEPLIWKAAICHDVVEDCDVTLEKLSSVIGSDAASIVGELTFFPDPDSPVSKQQQKSDYMASFATKSVEALVIKVADRICNTSDFHNSESITDHQYAYKYWNKAKDLMDAFVNRTDEVLQRFTINNPEVIVSSFEDQL